jgi:hypothetical protein
MFQITQYVNFRSNNMIKFLFEIDNNSEFLVVMELGNLFTQISNFLLSELTKLITHYN